MKPANKALALLSVALITASAEDNKPGGQEVKTFLSCPIVRDTKTVPCWLAENQGETYYLGIQADQAAAFQPPQLLHKVLVEGSVKTGERICGGVVLSPIKISVMPEIDYSCNLMLPAVDEYAVPFAERGPGPNNPAPRAAGPRPVQEEPKPPFPVREFTLYYDFDAERAGRMARVITEAMTYAKAAHAKQIQIQGYRAAVRLSDGTNLEEYPWIAQHRAEVMAETLRDLGIPASTISSAWKGEPDTGVGSDAYLKRRLTITVIPD